MRIVGIRSKIKKTAMFLFVFAMVAAPVLFGMRIADLWNRAEAAPSINDLRRQITNQEARISSNAAQRRGLDTQIASARADQRTQVQMRELYTARIGHTEDEITEYEFLLALIDEYIEQSERNLEELQARHDHNFNLFLELLRFTYKRGSVGHLELFLRAESLSDLLTQIDRMAGIANYTRDILINLENDRLEIQQSRETFELSKLNKEDYTAHLNAMRQSLREEQAELDRSINSLDSEIAAMEAQQRQIDRDNAAMQNDIQRRIAEIAAIEAAANRTREYVGGTMLWPVDPSHRRISSPFGPRIHPITRRNEHHNGIDIPAPGGRNIYAANSGTVIIASFNSSAGNFIVIDHGGGTTTLYSHATRLLRSVGDTVNRGDVIATVGTTGMSTGNHLHFEVSENGTRRNPTNGWVTPP